MRTARLKTALKAARQLGFQQVALNLIYRVGLVSGYYRRKLRGAALPEGMLLKAILPAPTRAELKSCLGESGQSSLLREADEIVGGKFRQFGGEAQTLQLTPNGPLAHWTDYESGKIDLRSQTSDIKLIWEPARFGWAFVLGRAYQLSGEEGYAQAFWRLFEQFQQANPACQGPNWISGQEVGLRLMAFIWCGQVFQAAQSSSSARQSALAQAVCSHAARIPASLVYARSQNNNHLLSEAAALYSAALALPGHPQAAHWLRLGSQWLDWCFAHQIDQRGEYVQHSSNYQRLMLQIALWVHALQAHAPGLASPLAKPANRENLGLAAHWLIALLDPQSGSTPNLGANDGALIFPLSSCAFRDYRPVAQAAARAFLSARLAGGLWDEMSLWFGLPSSTEPPLLPRYPGEALYAPHSWGYLRAVRYNSRPSHADQLHFDLWWRGLNLALDPGTYLYNAEAPWDNSLCSTLVHNTVSVDGLEQMTRAGRFLYLDWADASLKQHFSSEAEYIQQVSGQCGAYRQLGIEHERRVTVFSDERWLVEDNLRSTPNGAAHIYRLHWLLPDYGWQLSSTARHVELRLASPLGEVCLRVQSDQQIYRCGLVRAGELLSGEGLLAPNLGWFSPTYAHKTAALALAIEVQSNQNVSLRSEFKLPQP